MDIKENTLVNLTVGRCVWFFTVNHQPDQQPFLAMIAYVLNNHCVNLAIWDSYGNPIINPPTNVPLFQEGEELPKDGGHYCRFPDKAKMGGEGIALKPATLSNIK